VGEAYLLTGRPGVGKTTLLREAIAAIEGKAGGFYTREMRSAGVRTGFELVTLDGTRIVLAGTNIRSPYQVSKYGVDINALNAVGVPAIQRAMQECQVVVIDEIGKMELFSIPFRKAVWEALKSGKKVIGTIMLQSHPLADEVKRHPGVTLISVTRENHREVLTRLKEWLRHG
jgi:nucleoside-triphosphatase